MYFLFDQEVAQAAAQGMNWEKLLGIASAVVGLAIAVTNFLRLRSEPQPGGQPIGSPLKVSRLRKDGVGKTDKKIRVIEKRNLLVLSLMCLFYAAFNFVMFYYFIAPQVKKELTPYEGPTTYSDYALPLLLFYLGLYFSIMTRSYLRSYNLLRKASPGSRTAAYRKREIVVEGDYDSVFAQCIKALRKLGARVTELDKEKGLIKAAANSKKRYFIPQIERSILEDKIEIEIKQDGSDRYVIEIGIDGVRPAFYLDPGVRNSRQAELFMQQLID